MVRNLLNSTTEGIWGIDADGLITFINPSAVKLFGYNSANEMIGKNSHDLVRHSHADGLHYPKAEFPIYNAKKEGAIVAEASGGSDGITKALDNSYDGYSNAGCRWI